MRADKSIVEIIDAKQVAALSEAEQYEYEQCMTAQSEQFFNGDADTLLNRKEPQNVFSKSYT